MNFVGAHIVSIDQFQRVDVEEVFSVADRMLPYALRQRVTRVLEGAILGNMFFEASTRTRVSFGSAFNLMGGEVRETAGFDSSALIKGESLQDTARVLSGFSDVICMRHPVEGSVADFAAASRVPVLSGGDGANEHPTQALLDLYTIRKEMAAKGRAIDGLKIAMIGDLRYGRTVHSLGKLLCLYSDIEVVLISPKELRFPAELVDSMLTSGIRITVSDHLIENITDVDIVYSTRIQEERFSSKQEADLYRGKFRLNHAIYTQFCQPNTVIMHPLPRDSRIDANELDADLDTHPNLAIFRQTDNGLLVRMALFAMVLNVVDQVDDYAFNVRWFNARQT